MVIVLALIVFGSPLRQGNTMAVVDLEGRPVRGVDVYACGPTDGELLGTTTKTGVVTSSEDPSFLLAMAKDGRLAVAVGKPTVRFGSFGTVRLRVVDGSGAPVANKEITIRPTRESVPIGKHGDVDSTPRYPRDLMARLKRRTNAAGWVTFDKIQKGVGFAVLADVGLTAGMLMQGAVFADRPAKVLLRNDCEITGTVSGSPQRPLPAGLEVTLLDTGGGHAGGYPGAALRNAKVDAKGRYRFNDLPNGTFRVALSWPRKLSGLPTIVEASIDKEAWWVNVRDVSDEDWLAREQDAPLKQKTTTWDFRLTVPSKR